MDVECIFWSEGVQLFQNDSESDKSMHSSDVDNVDLNDLIDHTNTESNGSIDVNDCPLSDTSDHNTNEGFL